MSYCVLFVDDEEVMLDALRRQVGKKYEVKTAKGGEEGLRILAVSEEIQVVIADMKMPSMNGLDFLSRVKERSPKVIRMMLTGNVDRKTAEDAVKTAEVFHYLTKPCDTHSLLQAIQMGCDLYDVQKDLSQMSSH